MSQKTKKADVAEHPQVFDHAGLLVNEPPKHARVALYLVIRQLFTNFRAAYRSHSETLPPRLHCTVRGGESKGGRLVSCVVSCSAQ